MQLVIAEKPSVARDLARVLGVRASSGVTAFEGERCVITWCIGHLVELVEPATYNPAWKAWRLDNLPMLPEAFKLQPSKHAVPQLRAVTALLKDKRFVGVVNACDAGREGELIFRYVYQYAHSKLPVQRLWISSLTDEAIRKGLQNLRAGADFVALADAARSRSEADWLVGMNATRAVTSRGRQGGHQTLYSIGRVQTPTLAMLVERELELRAFVPKPYWEVRASLKTDAGEPVGATWRDGARTRLATAELAQRIEARDMAVGGAIVERVKATTVREPPPQLFDLTTLQRTANKRYGFSAQRTLELAQALYERHKLLTYPRTDSRHLSSDVAKELAGPFTALADVPAYAAFAQPLLDTPPRPNRRVVDDSKVRDHHAIIPTGKAVNLGSLDHDESRLFDLVARRFLGAFFPDAEFASTEVWLRVGDGPARKLREAHEGEREEVITALPPLPDRYLVRGRVRLVAGWQDVAGIEPRTERPSGTDDDERNLHLSLPKLVEGQRLSGTFAPVAKQTTPPPRYSEATLLAAMETAGKRVTDEALRDAMKDTGLGTPATRASIIETLLRRNYIERDRQTLVATELGINLITAIPIASLASPELTGQWEARLAAIARGAESRDAFMADIERFCTEMVDIVRSARPPAAPPAGSVPQQQQWKGKGKGGKTSWKKRGSTWSRPAAASQEAAPRKRASAKPAPSLASSPKPKPSVAPIVSINEARARASSSAPSSPRAAAGDISVASTEWLADAILSMAPPREKP